MNKVVIMTDTSSAISQEMAREYDVQSNKVAIMADCASIPPETARKHKETRVVAGTVAKLPWQEEIVHA